MTLPYLTDTLPGCGGVIKSSPEDFLVEELPAYQPCGSGEHLYLWLEKAGVTTLEAVRRLARALSVAERDIGYAGMKDAVGVTRQYLSVPRVSPEAALKLHLPGMRVLSAERHGNKLKLGHLRGNRFRIVIRTAAEGALDHAERVLAVLVARGVPNYFGYQRYGAQGNSHQIGLAMLRRDWQGATAALMGDPEAVRDESWRSAIGQFRAGNLAEALQLMPRHCQPEREVLRRLLDRPQAHERAFGGLNPRLRKLYLSAAQSFLFDLVLAERIGQLDHLVAGDLACKHANGACFPVVDPGVEGERLLSFEISATGPLFGCRMKQPEGEPGRLEQELLTRWGLAPDDFDLGGGLRMDGERRPLRIPLADASCTTEGEGLVMEFSLPRGSYATSVLREVMKNF